MVVLNGRVLDGKTLNEVGEKGRQRLPFWWERD
jgi:hypothetical protein